MPTLPFICINTLDDAYALLNKMKVYYEGRAYHNVSHVRSMLADLGECCDGNVSHSDWQMLCYAILFHDFIYDPRRNDNEERSAAAWQCYAQRHFDLYVIREVSSLIRITAGYLDRSKANSFKDDSLAKKLAELDLGILIRGTDLGLEAFEHAIRKEYAWVEWHEYQSKRIEVLEQLIIFFKQIFDDGVASRAIVHCQYSQRYLAVAEVDFALKFS